jgi:pyruvate/2-oxoglutarate/acetoin dehydrogenase E1 component
MTDNSLSSYSTFISVAIKHFTRDQKELISYEAINSRSYERVCVCIVALVIRNTNRIFFVRRCIVSTGACLAGQYISTLFHKVIFSKKKKNTLKIKFVF